MSAFWLQILPILLLIGVIRGQPGRFSLPALPQGPHKPTVPKGLESYFRLKNPDWVRAFGLSGFIPERNFDFAETRQQNTQEQPATEAELLRKLSELSGAAGPPAPAGIPQAFRNLPGLQGLARSFGGAAGTQLPGTQLPGALQGSLPDLEGLARSLGGLTGNPEVEKMLRQTLASFNPQSSPVSASNEDPAAIAAAQRARALATALSAQTSSNANSQPNVRKGPLRTSPTSPGSSISGIPNIFPTLPKAPQPRARTRVDPGLRRRIVPRLPSAPVVPNGGFGPGGPQFGGLPPELLSQVQPGAGTGLVGSSGRGPSGFGSGSRGSPFKQGSGISLGSAGPPPPPPTSQAADLASLIPKSVPAAQTGTSNLFTQLAQLLGIGTRGAGASPGVPANPGAGLDLSNFNSLLGLGSKNQGVLSSVLYSALTDGTILQAQKDNDTSTSPLEKIADAANLRSNVALVQQILTQPDSPLCNPKPYPVTTFDVDAFMGTWYQTLYSPPMSQGPCSMVACKCFSGKISNESNKMLTMLRQEIG